MTILTLNEINNNSIYQPPKEWIDEIEKEEQLIKDNFYSNNFDVWEIIRIKKKEMEDNEAIKKYNEWLNKVKESDDLFEDNIGMCMMTFKQMGLYLKQNGFKNYGRLKSECSRIWVIKRLLSYKLMEEYPLYKQYNPILDKYIHDKRSLWGGTYTNGLGKSNIWNLKYSPILEDITTSKNKDFHIGLVWDIDHRNSMKIGDENRRRGYLNDI